MGEFHVTMDAFVVLKENMLESAQKGHISIYLDIFLFPHACLQTAKQTKANNTCQFMLKCAKNGNCSF